MAVIYINRSNSRCGECGKGAFPSENAHLTQAGYVRGVKGCGAIWTAVGSDYGDIMERILDGERFFYDNLVGLPAHDDWNVRGNPLP